MPNPTSSLKPHLLPQTHPTPFPSNPTPFLLNPFPQSPIISPHSQSPQAFYSPNKRPFSTFQKPRPRPFISPDPAIPMAASGYIYQNPGVAMSPQPLARPFVPGSMVMPGPFAMSGIVSPQQQVRRDGEFGEGMESLVIL